MSRRPLIAAHRGGALVRPENSRIAFRHALALGSDLVELDVHLTTDGELAVIHDATLDRTTTAHGPVGARSSTELRAVRLRGLDGAPMDEGVPLLEEILALLAPPPVDLLLEVKGPTLGVRYERRGESVEPATEGGYVGIEARLLRCLREAGMASRTTIMSFNPGVLARVRELAPGQRMTFLVARAHVERSGARPADAVRWAAALGASDLGVEFTLVDADLVAAARAAGLALGAWTVNEEVAMRRLADLGIDVLTTDRPDLALALFPRP